jgi:glycosyltransferase involved in cell wall biosynthesis
MAIMSALTELIEGDLVQPGSEERRRVLVCVPRYLPGYKSGGPIRAIANMVANLSPYFDFYVVTRDRDATDAQSYPGVTPNEWYRVGRARVLYCASIEQRTLRRAFHEVRPDIISLNSFQDKFTRVMMVLRRGGVFGNTPVLVAPRGEFSPEAMKIKGRKKVLYRRSAKLLRLYENVLWQVSTPREKPDLLRAAPAQRLVPESIHVACEMSDAIASTAPHLVKESGSVKLAFIARMSEMKNLHFLLEILREIRGNVLLNLFGPVAGKDVPYWERCKALMAQLPANINVDYQSSIEHAFVPQVLHDHHFFVLPTRGENFCHAAVEAFVNGTPVILSDATPWTNLNEARAGFDISLQDWMGWTSAIQECVDMDQRTYATYLSGAREYGRRFSVEEAVCQHLAMFDAALDLRLGRNGR